jgi:hypothetical protein
MDGVDLRGADLRRFPPRTLGASSTQEDANLDRASLTGAIWNEQTQWPDKFDPAKRPELARQLGLIKDEQLLAHSPDGTEVLAVVGGSVDTQEGWEGGAISKSLIIGGHIVGILRDGKWTQLAKPQPSTTELQPLGCAEYENYWPGTVDLGCHKRIDRACPNLPAPAIPEPRRRQA